MYEEGGQANWAWYAMMMRSDCPKKYFTFNNLATWEDHKRFIKEFEKESMKLYKEHYAVEFQNCEKDQLGNPIIPIKVKDFLPEGNAMEAPPPPADNQ